MKGGSKAFFPDWFLQTMLVTDLVLEAILVFIIAIAICDVLFGTHVPGGYEIRGWAEAFPFVLTIAYFFAMRRFFSGTLATMLDRWLRRVRR